MSSETVFPPGRLLGPDFFSRSSDQVAPDLIGKILWSPGVGGGRLTEVEAYLPVDDPASHAARGPTRRNAAMFGPPGTIYVFLSYGVHYLLNFVTGGERVGSAVLIRAMEALKDRRPGGDESYCGPGLLGAALGVRPELNGLALGPESGLYIIDDGSRPRVGITTRVGITQGAALPLRYYASDSRCVTRRSAIQGGT
jgi:DNA-3-methyladenine glycosylase